MLTNLELAKMYKKCQCLFDDEQTNEHTMCIEGREMVVELVFSHVKANNLLDVNERLVDSIQETLEQMEQM